MKADASSSAAEADNRRASRRRSFWLLLAAAGATAVWFLFLLLTAIETANPVTVNRKQLLASDALVVAVPGPSSDGAVSLTVERSLAGVRLDGPLEVGGIEPERFAGGGAFLVPLIRKRDGYLVTPAPAALNGTPLVYPANDETLRAAEAIVAARSPNPYR